MKNNVFYLTLGPMIAFIRQLEADSINSLSPSQSLPHTNIHTIHCHSVSSANNL